MDPRPPDTPSGNLSPERLDEAVQHALSVSKDELLKREALWSRNRVKKKAQKPEAATSGRWLLAALLAAFLYCVAAGLTQAGNGALFPIGCAGALATAIGWGFYEKRRRD